MLCAGCKAAHQGQIAAPVSHHLDHETTPRGNSGLFDFVHCVNDVVQGCIRTDAELRTGQIVVDGGSAGIRLGC